MMFKLTAYADRTRYVDFTVSNALQTGSDVKNINKNMSYNYASLEVDTYDIDNPRPLYLGGGLALSTAGQSDEYGNIAVTITANIGHTVNFSGVSIDSDCTIESVVITTYNGDVQVDRKSFSSNEDKSNYFETLSTNVSKVEISISRIKEKNKFLDIYNVNFGKVFILDDSSIKDLKMINQFSVSGRELPIDSLEFTLFDIPYDLMLDNHQKIDTIDDNNVTKFTFYIDDWEYNEDKDNVKITCNDVVSLLETDFAGFFGDSIYHYDKSDETYIELDSSAAETQNAVFETVPITVKNLVNDYILKGTDIICGFDDEVADTYVTGTISATTRRNALIYIANATGYKIIKQPYLKIVKPSTVSVKTFDESNIFKGTQKATNKRPCRSVTINKFRYTCDLNGDMELTYSENLTAGNHELSLSQISPPFLVGLRANNVDASHPKYIYSDKVKFTLTNNSLVKIFLRPYSQKKYGSAYIEIPNADLYPNYSDEIIDSFTLISDYEKRLSELLEYYSKKEEITAKVLWENPQIGAMVDFEGELKTVRKISTNFNDSVEIEVE